MKPVLKVLVAIVAIATVGSGAFAGKKQYDYWQATRPIERNFEKTVKAMMDRQAAARQKPQGWALCAQIPVDHPAPDARSKGMRVIGWHIDFIKDAPRSAERVRQLQQLDALADVGLLSKESTAMERGGQQLDAVRYALNEQGWATSALPGRNCLEYGTVEYLGFIGAKEIEYKGLKLQEVSVRVGIPSAEGLKGWARNPAVQAAFPDIQKDLEGRRVNYVLQLVDGTWVEYNENGPQNYPSLANLPPEEQRQLLEVAALPDPTKEELEKAIFQIHERGTECIALPGSERLPVDRLLMSNNSPIYRVGIYLDKQRTAYDKVATKTQPLADKLAAVGGLIRHPPQRVQGEGRDGGQLFDMVTYELPPQLQALLPQHGPRTCLPLGDRALRLVDAQYRTTDQLGYPGASFTYKLRITSTKPPAELTDPVLLSAWPDLRNALDKGVACGGEFSFNKRERRSEGGGGSCWPMYDSYAENY